MPRHNFVPVTPAGTPCVWLTASTREEAIKRLLHDARHMPYGTWKNFQKRGYTIDETNYPAQDYDYATP